MPKSIKQLERELAFQKSRARARGVIAEKAMKRRRLQSKIRALKYHKLLALKGPVRKTAGELGRGFKVMGKQAASGFQKATRKGGYLDRLASQSGSRRKKGKRQGAFGF